MVLAVLGVGVVLVSEVVLSRIADLEPALTCIIAICNPL